MSPTRPRPITVISWVFIVFGCIALVFGLLPLADPGAFGQNADGRFHLELGLASLIRILAVLGGTFMLHGFNWARWLLVAWMGYHVILSVLHPPLELLMHSLIFAVFVYFLFRPEAAAYFRGARATPRYVRGG